MNLKLTEIGSTPWTRAELISALDEFADLYQHRPVKDNSGGMRSPHMFAVWFMVKKLAPDLIVESGIWHGQSTWLLEQACPTARLVSIDINLAARQYISPRATYSDRDFSRHDWSGVTDRSLVFFDDHQNAYQRAQQCKWVGFKHLIFEDNYDAHTGDCYSLKKAFAHAGFEDHSSQHSAKKRSFLKRLFHNKPDFRPLPQSIEPNDVDAKMLRRNLEIYYEFPPVFKPTHTRGGDAWTDEKYPTPEPLLKEVTHEAHQLYLDEAKDYTWICYAKLK